MDKRQLDLLIISDAHLGAYECHAKELLMYLRSVTPEILVLNGDFVDMAKFHKKKLPETHRAIIKEIIKMALANTKVYYITSNKKELEESFSSLWEGLVQFREKLDLRLKGQRYWIFHGAALEPLLKIPFFLSRPGGVSYSLFLQGNKLFRKWGDLFRKNKNLDTRKVNNLIRRSPNMIETFEERVTQSALGQGYDYVVCGHVHQPVIKQFLQNEKKIVYMNAGDWVENLTALEFRFGKWKIYNYDELDYKLINPKLTVKSKKPKAEHAKSNAKRRFGSIVERRTLRSNRSVGEK